MRKKKFNAVLALLLVFSMAFSQPAAVFAEEGTTVSSDENNSDAVIENEKDAEGETLSEDENKEDEQTPADDNAQPGNEEQTPGEDDLQTGDDSQAEDDSQTPGKEDGSQTGDDVQTPDEGDASQIEDEEGTQNPDEDDASQTEDNADVEDSEDSDEALKAEAQSNGISVENQKKLNALGFKTMPISRTMRQEKETLAQVAKNMSTMKAGTDYLEGEVVYFADSEEDARKVAECYGGTVEEYSYGIALADIKQSVTDAVEVAADMTIPIPAVYPNIVYTIAEDWDVSSVDTSEVSIEDVSQEAVDSLQAETDSEIDESEENQIYVQSTSDEDYNKQWHHGAINTLAAWGESDKSKGAGVTVAVLDTGVDYDHPDLKDNVKERHTSVVPESAGGSTDGKDMNGHGTHCAGLIAAAKNTIGGVGVAPNANIYSIQVMDEDGAGNTLYTALGLALAYAGDVDVVSMSLGSVYYDAALQKVIDQVVKKGIVVVAAAGNGDLFGDGISQKTYPAAYNNVIAVAASNEDYSLTSFSNYGSWVDIAAPGYEIYSTLPATYTYYETKADGSKVEGTKNYGTMSGTSMACPIVAGTVALMLANNDSLKNTNSKSCVDKITKELKASSTKRAFSYWYWYRGANPNYYYEPEYYNEPDPYYSYPLVDAENAVYAMDDSPIQIKEITFSSGAVGAKNTVTAGPGTTFTLKAGSEHDKIRYTINGKKPTANYGSTCKSNSSISMNGYSGKVKIQAIAIRGSKTSKVFSKTYTFDVKATELTPDAETLSVENGIPTASMNVAPGKSISLVVTIIPAYVSNTKLKWTCEDDMIKVNKSGKVTCNKKATEGHEAVVKVETTDGSNKQCQFKIKVAESKVSSITLNASELTMSWWAPSDGTLTIDGKQCVKYFQLKPTDSDNKQYLYKSSNTKVAYVNPTTGWIAAMGKGKAKITVTSNDGSNKKAVCTVNVITPVYDITYLSSNGYWGYSGHSDDVIPIATGCSLKLKTVINNNSKDYIDKPSNKTLNWSSDKDMITAKNGKITCSKTATPGTKVKVTVSAKAGNGNEACTITFLVVDKVEKIYIESGSTQAVGLAWNQSVDSTTGRPRNVRVGDATRDPMYGTYVGSSNTLTQLKVKTASGKVDTLKNYIDTYNCDGLFGLNISNRDIVQNTALVDAKTREPVFCLVATKPGSAAVDYVLNDGSKKKFTVKVKVGK